MTISKNLVFRDFKAQQQFVYDNFYYNSADEFDELVDMLMGKPIIIEKVYFHSHPVTADITIYLGKDNHGFDTTGKNNPLKFYEIILEEYFEFR